MATLDRMRSLARAAGRSSLLSRELAQAVQVHGVRWLDRWVRGSYQYRPEEEEVIRTFERMADEYNRAGYFEGDCDDVGVFLCGVLATAEIPCRFVALRVQDSEENFSHVFVEAETRSGWVAIDPTVREGLKHHYAERMVLNV